MQLKIGALVQGRYKLLTGYPGWGLPAWDGWYPLPTSADEVAKKNKKKEEKEAGASKLGDVPLVMDCTQSPCLFDVEVSVGQPFAVVVVVVVGGWWKCLFCRFCYCLLFIVGCLFVCLFVLWLLPDSFLLCFSFFSLLSSKLLRLLKSETIIAKKKDLFTP